MEIFINTLTFLTVKGRSGIVVMVAEGGGGGSGGRGLGLKDICWIGKSVKLY